MSLDENSMSAIDHHKRFIEVIRDSVWSRIKFEDEFPPSFEALKRHWHGHVGYLYCGIRLQ